MVNDMVSNNIILELVQMCILHKDKIYNNECSFSRLSRDGFRVSVNRGVDCALINFNSSTHNFSAAIEFNKSAVNAGDILIGNKNTYKLSSLLYTRSSIIVIDDERDEFDASEESTFRYSLTLSTIKFKYYKIVKLFKEYNIQNDFYIHMMEDCKMADSDFKKFFVLYEELIL